jgi:hypothetical protein
MTPEEFWDILHAMPEPQPLAWRLYYDFEGRPITYSMEALPGNYIDIDPQTYARGPLNVRVVNGELKYITQKTSEKLVPGDAGTQCHVRDISIIVKENGTHWSKQIYGTESN